MQVNLNYTSQKSRGVLTLTSRREGKLLTFFLCFRVKSLCYSVTNSFVCTARFTLRCRLWFDLSWTATCVGVQIKWGKLWKHSISHDVACLVAQHWHYHHKSVCSSAFIQAKHQELCMLAFELCWLHGNSLTFKWKRGCYLTRAQSSASNFWVFR